MNISAISSTSSAANVAAMQSLRADLAETGVNSSKSTNSSRDPVAIKKAASQFEAIILRQLLAPSIEPVMSGGLGGTSSAGSGIYGYMLTDTLANSLSQAGGLGLGRMLEKQLTPRTAEADIKSNGQSQSKLSTGT
ncbi:MAG: rod-binding protein [Nibricoccus sp.]